MAAELILKKGFSSTSMNDIASQLGFNKAALYHYCRNKEEIALEIEQINLEHVKRIFGEINEKCDSGLDKLRHFYISYAKMMATPFGAAGVQIVAQPISDEFAQRSKLLFKETDDTIRGYIKQGQIDKEYSYVFATRLNKNLTGIFRSAEIGGYKITIYSAKGQAPVLALGG